MKNILFFVKQMVLKLEFLYLLIFYPKFRLKSFCCIIKFFEVNIIIIYEL